MVIFEGACTRCGVAQTWTDLTQELSCLEAKNCGNFGECSLGVHVEEHDFDQECSSCAEEDEGIGDLEEVAAPFGSSTVSHQQSNGKRSAEEHDPIEADFNKQRT